MQQFLSQARSAPVKTLVLGNQALDMDSFCSSIVTAYLETLKGRPCTPYIPIVRSDLRLRKDVELVMSQLKLDPNHLLFADSYTPADNTDLFLVDHNRPFVKGHVTSIIDHHEPEESYKLVGIDPLVLSMSASSISLVLKYYSAHMDLSKVFEDEPLLAPLSYAPLVIDSSNFFKMKAEDVFAYQFLAKFVKDVPDTISFNTIREARKDTAGLSMSDLLNKDYKEWDGIGISTLPSRFHKLDLERLSKCMIQRKEEKHLDVLAAMACGKKGRDFAYAGPTDFDVRASCPALQLIPQVQLNGVQFFSQMEASFSRKQVAPILRSAFAEFEKTRAN